MTDWGLPDWRDPSSYAETSLWSDLRWRWEFLRWRKDLRRDFDLFAPKAVALRNADNLALGMDEVLDQVNSPTFTTAPFGGKAYGYEGIPNPRISALSDAFLNFISLAHPNGGLHPYYAQVGVPAYPEGVFFDPDQAVWVFDLDFDLEIQLARAREQIGALQAERANSPSWTKNHKLKWPTYLQLLCL